jgi:hypothetical protein
MGYCGYAGALTEIAKQIMDTGMGSNPQGFKFPLVEALANGFDRVSDASVAMDRGENPAEVMLKLPLQLAQDQLQTARIFLAWTSEEQQRTIEEQNKQRDLRVFRRANDIPVTPLQKGMSNPFLSKDERAFKQSENPAEAAAMVPGLLQRAMDRSGGNPELLRQNVNSLRQPLDMPYPSQRSTPQQFSNYMQWLGETQGGDAVQKALADIAMRQQLQQVRAGMVPRL